MLSRFDGFDRRFDVLAKLAESWGYVPAEQAHDAGTWPRLDVLDDGANLVVTGDVPGMTEKDFDIRLEDGVLTIKGERKAFAPEGYEVLRRERHAARFQRSLALPQKVDVEKTTARVKDGVLTITLAKAPEARPRQIAVRGE